MLMIKMFYFFVKNLLKQFKQGSLPSSPCRSRPEWASSPFPGGCHTQIAMFGSASSTLHVVASTSWSLSKSSFKVQLFASVTSRTASSFLSQPLSLLLWLSSCSSKMSRGFTTGRKGGNERHTAVCAGKLRARHSLFLQRSALGLVQPSLCFVGYSLVSSGSWNLSRVAG